MKKRIVILISVFFVFLIFFEFILNYEKHGGHFVCMFEATLPVVATQNQEGVKLILCTDSRKKWIRPYA